MTKKVAGSVQALLEEGLHAHEIRIERRYHRAIARDFASSFKYPIDRQGDIALTLCRFLAQRMDLIIARIGQLQHGQMQFTRRYGASKTLPERRQLILDYARELGATPLQLLGDRRAFRRWFGADAIQDRARIALANAERSLASCIRGMGRVAANGLARTNDPAAFWKELNLQSEAARLLSWEGDQRVRVDAFRAMSLALRALPDEMRQASMDDATAAYVYRAAMDPALDVWLQQEALILLYALNVRQVADVIADRLSEPRGGDDLFVRAFAVEFVAKLTSAVPQVQPLYKVAARDSSPHVRQRVAQMITHAPDDVIRDVWPILGRDDPIGQVRAAAILQLPAVAARAQLVDEAVLWMTQALQSGFSVFCTRVALRAVEEGASRLRGEAYALWVGTLHPVIESLHVESPHLPVRRWAAETRERIWCATDAKANAIFDVLQPEILACRAGRKRHVRLAGDRQDDEITGRVLSCLAQRDYGLTVQTGRRGLTLARGDRFGFRMWRLLHEWRRPSPDKRQAFSHTIGRIYGGQLSAPSAILAELAETKVPGEPLQMASESGWRPYLPIIDQLISVLDENTPGKPLNIYTAEGVTTVSPPRTIAKRLLAKAKLTKDFKHYADLRNWSEGSAAHPSNYLRAVADLGFEIRFRAHPSTAADSSVTRFFPVMAALPLPELRGRIENYFFSAYDNTLWDLSLFIGLSIAGFIGHHAWVNYRMRSARNGIPLVVGGWGTRGKSGTERLKAAMFNALGYSVVSKTTGCEAMFLYSPPHGELREMFLFRPYDKATIWEQMNVVRLANKLGAEVFLWECMALTPAFVRLLQRAWMRDDISTLTNTFPDHEDLQGPAGINIPQVMTEFIPRGRVLFTTEEQMRPILQSAADDLGTTLKGVGWLESGLIPPDILARFPYQEHPDNIALVAAMGSELGVSYDFAVKAMADNVVMDLGVLKTFEPAALATRRLEFANGMSANERYGCLGNWKRLGFDRQDMDAEPGVVISTVVNNRADRIARSQVFAGVLVEDIRADFHVLIGSNLDGLQGYLRDTWLAYAERLTLWPEQSEGRTPSGVLDILADNFRLPYTSGRLTSRLAVMLSGAGLPDHLLSHCGNPDALASVLQAETDTVVQEVVAFHRRDVAVFTEYRALYKACEGAGASPDPQLNRRMQEQFWSWFRSRIVVVEDYYASGDAVIATICRATPPGFRNRIMGLQNIKGTGLDFVYRWLAWDVCQRACKDLLSRDGAQQRRGITVLGSFQDFGILSEETVRNTIAECRQLPHGKQARIRAELDTIQANLDRMMLHVREKMQSQRSNGWADKVIASIEGFLDAGDAIRRRRQADQIYAALVKRRISEARAVVELQRLTQRQKGGWLSGTVQGISARTRQFFGFFNKKAAAKPART